MENLLLSSNCQIKLCDFGSATTEQVCPDHTWTATMRGLVEEEVIFVVLYSHASYLYAFLHILQYYHSKFLYLRVHFEVVITAADLLMCITSND